MTDEGSDAIVTVNARLYNRLMAEEMAKDIEFLSTYRPECWSIGDNSTLRVGRTPVLSFAEPIRHGYIIDTQGLSDEVERLVLEPNQQPEPSSVSTIRPIMRAAWSAPELSELRSAHERAVIHLAPALGVRAVGWMWHNLSRFADLELIVGRVLPKPAYWEELLEWRKAEAGSTELGKSPSISGFDRELLARIADGIRVAHEVNPKSWSLYRIKSGGLILSISGYSVAFVAQERGSWMLHGDPNEERFSKLKGKRMNTDFAEIPEFVVFADSRDDLKSIAADYEEDFLAAIDYLARMTKTVTPRAADFQAAVLEQLSKIAGQELPTPAYASETYQPQSMGQPQRFWKISPGANAKYWNHFRDKSVIAVHWLDEPKDLRSLPTNKSEFVKTINTYPDATSKTANALWEFRHDMKPGDPVLAYGDRTVLGSGEITGEYESVEDDFPYHHRRAVNWKSLTPLPTTHLPDSTQRKLARNATVVELTEEEFDEAIGRPAQSPMTGKQAIQRHFIAGGLSYTDAQLATFYTALQTKGFVVLSGISGTGKSKIAQGFVDMMPEPAMPPIVVSPRDEGLIRFTLKPYTTKYKRVILPAKQVEVFPSMEPGQSVEVPLQLGAVRGTGRLENRIHTNGSLLRILYFRKEIADELVKVPLGHEVFLDPEMDDDGETIRLIEILTEPPTAISSHPNLEAGKNSLSNHLFLSVRPDWRDSTSLLGYFNPLTQTYEWTDFLRFILRAAESYRAKDGLAWFVILDEMNLAHVEYYFADLLSVIESGRQPSGEDAGFTREPLRTTYPDTLDDEMPPHEIFLPPNLYIIGTVNMDETTHAFSPKVLDRAFTIELTDVSFDDYPPAASANGDADVTESDKRALLAAFTRDGRFHGVDKDEVARAVMDHQEFREWLGELNRLLAEDRFHFGYRTFDEIAQYIVNNDLNGMMAFGDAFDQAVFMKVLPKFSGSRARLRGPLVSVLAWAIDPAEPLPKAVVTDLDTHLAATSEALANLVQGAAVPRVARRALEMLERVELDGFVSFG